MSSLFRHCVSGKYHEHKILLIILQKGGKSYLIMTNIKLRLKSVFDYLLLPSIYSSLASQRVLAREKKFFFLFFSRKIVSMEEQAPCLHHYFTSMFKRLNGTQARRMTIGVSISRSDGEINQ